MATNSEIFEFNIDAVSDVLLTHPGDSNTLNYSSDKLRGDGYYGRSDGLHTVQYNLSGFLGSISVQATLESNPTEDDWFYAPITLHTATNTGDENSTGSFIYNFTGNYVWVRINVASWTDGSVRSAVLNH